MTYPSGGPGYPQQGGPQQQPQTPNNSLSGGSLAVILALAVTVLGLINYFIGFSEEAGGVAGVVQLLLAGGLLAALRVLPNGPKVLPFAALLSVLGALMALLNVVHSADVPGVVTVMLILAILQMLVAVAALLFDYNVLKMPAAKPQAGPYGQQYGQPGQYGGHGQGQFGQPGPQDPPSGGFNQPTQYGPPATPPPGQQQATQYAPQQGQFYQQQQPPESGQQPGQQQGGPGQQS